MAEEVVEPTEIKKNLISYLNNLDEAGKNTLKGYIYERILISYLTETELFEFVSTGKISE